jgi:pimeloyl-ACP methyl ester carboxylesterase
LLADRYHLVAPDYPGFGNSSRPIVEDFDYTSLFELPYTRKQYLDGEPDPSLVSPDAWQHAQWGVDRAHNKDIQYALHANYATNFDRYEEWHAYFS